MDFMNVAIGILIIGVTVIIVVAVLYSVFEEIQKKRRRAQIENVLIRVAALEAKVADHSVESRLQALETIVTDHRNRLKEEIDTL